MSIKKREYQALRTKAVSSQGYFKHKTKTKTFQDHKCRYSKLSNAGLQLTTACHRDHNQIVHSYIHKNSGGVCIQIYIYIYIHTIFIYIHKYGIKKLKNILSFRSGKNICRTYWHELRKLMLNWMLFLCC